LALLPAVPCYRTPTLAPPSLSRALLTPGPLPPLSHLGATLLRHTVGTGLRYALYLLGLPVPEAPPVRIVRLRLYLDDGKLAALLGEVPGREEVAAALTDPGGAGALPPQARRLAAAAAFHRLRLRLPRLRGAGPPAAVPGAASPQDLAERFRAELSRGLPATNEALLADLLAALARRARRARGEEVSPALSRAARRLLAGGPVDLHRFGPPDLLLPSWAETPDRARAAREAFASQALPKDDPLRGRFREAYRILLDRLLPLYRATASAAVARGLLDSPEDAFFLPLDLAGDLAQDRKPSWLDGALRANRAEHEGLRRSAGPPERVTGLEEGTVTLGAPREWEMGPVLPLP
jgi:hypothetical protein